MTFNLPKQIVNVDSHLSYINLSNIMNVWVYKDENLCFLVDPGPMLYTNALKRNLKKLGVGASNLDYILLTHIHTDHAGSLGKLIEFFPDSKLICHPNGIEHLINPDKLWEKTVNLLGNAGEVAGKFLPVPRDQILSPENFKHDRIKVVETLGHAPHHQSFFFDKYLFIGEAASCILPNSEFLYPATPPIFDFDIYISSIEKLLSEDLTDFKICYPHFGIRDNASQMLQLGHQQITTWLRVINSIYEDRDKPEFTNLLMGELKKEDKNFANIDKLTEVDKKRAPSLIRGSIKGILGYIKRIKEAK